MDGSCLVVLVCLGRCYLPSFLVPSLSAGAFLIFLLNVKPCVLLAQLLFHIMVLLGEALHSSGESLNLSLEGGCAWFISLNIVGGHH